MPLVIRCEHCMAPLKLPEEFIGREVRCPSCQKQFVATEESASLPPRREEPPADEPDSRRDPQGIRPRSRPDDEDDRPRRRPDDDDRPRRRRDEEDDERPRRRAARYDDDDDGGYSRKESHRGGAIQTLGILSICLFCIPVAAITMAIIALVMAGTDLGKMQAGYMDRSGEAATRTGKTCATIGLVVTGCVFVLFMCISCSGGIGGGGH